MPVLAAIGIVTSDMSESVRFYRLLGVNVPEPDGDQWFHVRVVVAHPKISVFVNDAAKPALVVNELGDRPRGSVGLWVGDGSAGVFANLRVTRKP